MKRFSQPLFLIAIIIGSFIIVGVVLDRQKELTSPFVNIFEKSEKLQDIGTEIKKEGIEQIEQNSEAQQEVEEGKTEELPETNWQWVNEQKKLYELTATEINLVLKELWERFPNKAERLKALSILRLGTPYQLGCLGEEIGRDKEPIFRLDATDCTVFVLTNIALLHSQTLEEAKEMMKFLNYRPNSEITFENRLHFTTDRNITSPYFQDITEQIAGPDKIKEKEVILNKIKPDGKRLIDIDWEKEIVIKYIPAEFITKDLLQGLPEVVGVAFIKEGDEEIGLDVRHEGFLFEGELLFHATSVQEKLTVVNFSEYYFGENSSPRFDGMILFEIK